MISFLRSGALVLVVLLTCIASLNAQNAPATGPGISEPYFKTTWQTECQWLVAFMAEDAVRTGHLIAGKSAPGGLRVSVEEVQGSPVLAPKYQITVIAQGLEERFTLDTAVGIWNPELFLPILTRFAGTPPRGADAGAAEGSERALLHAGLNGGLEELLSEDLRLSSLLAKHPELGTLHAQGALLLGLVGLTEETDVFYDTRVVLCRMTIHMAAAKLLNAASGTAWELANVIHLFHQGRQTDGLRAIEGLSGKSPDISDWSVALRMRITDDYRLVPKDRRTPLVLRMSVRAWAKAIRVSRALAEVDGTGVDALLAWRIIGNSEAELGMGRGIISDWMPREIRFASKVKEAFAMPDVPGGPMAWSNVLPRGLVFNDGGGSPKVHVVGPSIWAMQNQRHLAEVGRNGFSFLRQTLGDDDSAEEFSHYSASALGGAWMQPFALLQASWSDEQYIPAVDGCVHACRTMPEVVPAGAWANLSGKPWYRKERYLPVVHPHANEWIRNNPPPGSAFDPKNRIKFPSLTQHPPDPAAHLASLRSMAPYAVDFRYRALLDEGDRIRPAADLKAALGPLWDYHAKSIQRFLTRTSWPEQAQIRLDRGVLDPNLWIMTGHAEYIGEDAVAAAAERARTGGAEPIRIANAAPFMVPYYVNKGQPEKALPWAEAGRDTASLGGLEAWSMYCDATGDFEGAFEALEALADGYDSPGQLIAYTRRRQKELIAAGLTEEVEAILSSSSVPYPKVTLANFSGAPKAGVFFSERTMQVQKAGLEKGDVVVAVNGYAIRSFEEYSIARDVNAPEPFTLIVFRKDRYFEVVADPPQRRFGVNMPNYRP